MAPAIPTALKGEQIPLWARIIALTDAYANMLTEQSISAAARTPEQALDELAQDEWHPLRRHAGAAAAARAEVGTDFVGEGWFYVDRGAVQDIQCSGVQQYRTIYS